MLHFPAGISQCLDHRLDIKMDRVAMTSSTGWPTLVLKPRVWLYSKRQLEFPVRFVYDYLHRYAAMLVTWNMILIRYKAQFLSMLLKLYANFYVKLFFGP